MTAPIETLSARPSPADLGALHALLRDAIEGGASVGFLLPVTDEELAVPGRAERRPGILEIRPA